MHLPVVSEQAITRPITPISADGSGVRDSNQQRPSNFVFRGEWLESATGRDYQPRHNLQIDPANRRAIDAYREVASQAPTLGRILDGYI